MKIPKFDLQIEQCFRNWQNLRQHIQARYPISINAKLPRLSDHSLVNLFSNQSIWKPAWPFLNRSFESIWSTGNVPKGLGPNSIKKSHTAARFETEGHMRSFKVTVEVKPEFIVSNTLTFLTWFWYHTDFFTFECFKWRVRLKVDGMKGCNWTIVRKLTGPDPNRTVISTKEDGHGPWLMDDSERSFKPLWSIVYGPKWTVRLKRSKHVKLL